MQAVKEYDARIDTKKRVTIRGARYSNYHVQEYENGMIVLEPRELKAPLEISKKTLSMMDKAAANFRKRKASKPLDLASFSDDKD